MAKQRSQRNRKTPVAADAPVAVFVAVCNPGGEGMVERGRALTEDEAVQWLSGRGSIVACDGPMRACRHRAQTLMVTAYGGAMHEAPHRGHMALPHFHPPDHEPPGVHAFYETGGAYAWRTGP
ncbi:MAG: hypothetical protein ACRC33_20190 [Gemmataceae bacterium]